MVMKMLHIMEGQSPLGLILVLRFLLAVKSTKQMEVVKGATAKLTYWKKIRTWKQNYGMEIGPTKLR